MNLKLEIYLNRAVFCLAPYFFIWFVIVTIFLSNRRKFNTEICIILYLLGNRHIVVLHANYWPIPLFKAKNAENDKRGINWLITSP